MSTNLPGSQRGEENAVTWSYMKQPEQNHKTICGQGKGIRWEGGKRIKLINTKWPNPRDAMECLTKFGFVPDG